jgi:hypothetical protein
MPHERVAKCKKHDYVVCIYTFREAVELGGASGAVAQVTQMMHTGYFLFFHFLGPANPT